jgi:phosphate transport system substrate-binding protein
MRARWLGALLMLLAAGLHAASVDPALPRYEPRTFATPPDATYVTRDGAIAIVGYNDMRDMLESIAARFTTAHPGAHIVLDLPGTRFAPAALAAGTSALAPMGAEFTPPQLALYRRATGSDPLEFRIAHASLDARALSGPLAVFVHRDNPVTALSLEQVARAFSSEALRWGDLGATGEWVDRPVHTYGVERGTPLALFLQKAALGGRPFARTMVGSPQSTDVVQHVGEDPLAIGFAAAMRTTASVRMLALAAAESDEAVALTPENIAAGRYPLDRFLLIYARRPLNSFAREFLRLVLSREGQEAVAASPQRYLPLSAREAAQERAKLE